MQGYSLKTRSLVSTWFSLIFFLLLIFYLGFIEFIQDSQNTKLAVDLLNHPIRFDVLNNVNSMKFKNRIVSTTVKKENTAWVMQEPRIIPAKKVTIDRIINTLKSIKVRTIHEFEPINIQSFSLDHPTKYQ